MDNRLLAITVLFLTHVTFIRTVEAQRNDSIAMLKLATTLQRAPKSWSNENYCKWEGVKCDKSSNRVIAIYLSRRNLAGTLPPELSTLSQLQHFSVEKNQLSGPLPSFANLCSLQKLYLGNNQFTSIPPGLFQGLTSLQVFSISTNWKLQSWLLTDDLAQCTSLEVFRASEANVSGTIPDIFSSLRRLQDLDLSYNSLTGNLPPSFANSTIQNLWLSNGYSWYKLSGSIDVLASMTWLRQAYLSHNSFTGQIPNFSNCKNLSSLDLWDNSLTGLVPLSLVSHPTLTNVTLEANYLQGPIPKIASKKTVILNDNNFCKDIEGALCDPVVTTFLNIASAFQYPVQLAEYWQGDDACSFGNFVTCDSHHKVIIVNLASLNLSGTISQDFSNLTHLRSLMLNDNNLTGPIPEGLTKLSNLQMIDISYNNFSGTLPNFSSSVAVYAKGNPFLIKPYSFEIQPKSSSKGKKRGSIIAGVTISVFVSVMVFALFIYKFKKRFTKLNEMEYFHSDDGVLSHRQSRDKEQGRNVVISIKFLRQVTNNFNEANILGRGGSGVVYKGELNDGTCIAVKRMEGTKEMKDFLAEMKVLTRVRHRRLVALLGYCINRIEKILVYEYMPKGTLRQHLFEWHERGFLPLTWVQRITIAIDVARGVEYLHSLAQETFIHRDLKPSNILLGEDMRAKIADFGLVKRTSDGRYSTETKVAGTFGYLAPEYAATGKVTTKVDVYAFGVILMEMITGRKAVDETVSDEGWMCMHLVTWFRSLMIKEDNVSSVIDNTLNPDNETLLSITKVAELAGHCTSSEPHKRPDMSYVVNTLGCLVEQWTPPSPQDQPNHCFDGKTVQLDLQFLQNMQVDEDNSTTCGDISCS